MPLLSIIVPVYNTGEYLSRCIESILNQTFTDFELLLVDDGSTDNSGSICDNYAQKDDRINVIHQKNAGVSAARNAGLNVSRGEYIGFVDSDDWIMPRMYEKLLSAVRTFNSDCAACGMVFFNEQGEQLFRDVTESAFFDSNDKVIKALFSKPIPCGGSCYNKIFRNTGIRFDCLLSYSEDWCFVCDYLITVNSLIIVSEPLYCITERMNSLTRNDEVIGWYKLSLGKCESLRLFLELKKDYRAMAVSKCLDDCLRYRNEMVNLSNNRKYSILLTQKLLILSIKELFRKNIDFISFVKYIYSLLKH